MKWGIRDEWERASGSNNYTDGAFHRFHCLSSRPWSATAFQVSHSQCVFNLFPTVHGNTYLQLVGLGHAISSLFVGVEARTENGPSVLKRSYIGAAAGGVVGGALVVVVSTLVALGARVGGKRMALGFWTGTMLVHVLNAAQQAIVLSSNVENGFDGRKDVYVAGFAIATIAAIVYLVGFFALPFFTKEFTDEAAADPDSDRARLTRLTSTRP